MAESFNVSEPLTKRLSGLLKEYPPGISILRELLQNADDAGATKISYIIDTDSYPKEDLVDAGLAEFQGPSLLVYNNSTFSDTDFESLKRLGDSQKLQEKIATGKFGLGFSSVYGWTDSPQILTGTYFVALSPHCTFKTRPDNGLRIDFVSEAPKFADSFEAFTVLAESPRKPFPGTIIRIPLRTEEQANSSKIINLAITPEDVLKEFKAFQSEVAESLLFLKNIETVEFEFDDRILGVAKITNVQESLSARTAIKTAITDGTAQSLAFQIHIRHQYHHEEGSIDLHQQYHVQHKLADINEGNTASNDFKQWAMKESFFPWIALAAPLNPLPVIQSRIFVSLPLPIFMKDNRVNIHGMFALSRDRRSLWTMMDAQSGGKITNEIHWNTYLFKKVVPVVWRQMLIELAKLGRPVYDYFPIVTPQALSLDETLADDVFEAVVREGSPIWYTTTNAMVPLSTGFVALEEPSAKLLAALSLFSIPIINKIPKRLIQLIRNSRGIRYTTFMPAAIRECLRDKFREQPEIKIPIPKAVELLKYIISDNIYSSHIHEIPLFPCKDGNLRSLQRKTFVNNDRIYISTPEEFKLFGGDGSRFLDLSVFDRDTIQRLQRDTQDDSWPLNLCRFDVIEGFRTFALQHGLLDYNSKDTEIEMNGNIDFVWIDRVWKWLDKYPDKNQVNEILNGMLLIPLQESKKLRRIVKPYGKQPLLTSNGPGGTLILQIFEKSGRQFPLVDERLKVSVGGFLYKNRCIADSKDISTTLEWITESIVRVLPKSLKDALRQQFISNLQRRHPPKLNDVEISRLVKLPIFKELEIQENLTFRYSYIAPDSWPHVVALRRVPVIPLSESIHFLDAAEPQDAQFLSELGYSPLTTKIFLQKYVVCNIENQPSWLIEPLIRFVFDNVTVTESWYKQLQNTTFVAVQRKNGTTSSSRLKPSQVIDKTAPIAELFFDDEEVFGDGIYTAGEVYHKHLSILGMKSHFDSEIADNRIQKFAEMQMSDELYKKCGLLIDFLSDRGSSVTFNPEWSSLLRLPAISVDGRRVVLPTSECRPESFKPLVESSFGIVSIDIKKSLYGDLGWNQILQPEVLGQRINVIATSPSVQIILAPIFEYIKSKAEELGDQLGEYVGKVKSQISVQKYLPGSIEGLWSCDDVFFDNAREFEPYLTILPRSYVSDFGDILKLFGVAEYPSAQCLLNVLFKLPSDEILETNRLDLAINILSRLMSFDGFDTNELRVPSIEGRLHYINEFISSDNMLAHPRVPEAFAFKYQIPRVHDDAAFLHHLNEADVFEDYCQEEQITTRIANTLKDYSLSTSFNEFIANAEDCGSATRVSWYLDAEDIRFPSDNLFSSELSSWQTPGLYVYNDGVFSEDDFKAFINTGAGSKADNSSKIGKHGLGSLTMYHFTDIPSMISGNYFVMFDPSRRYLPLHQGRRRAGLRIPLEIMKMRHKDHLVPFAGIGGYSIDMTKFEGTVFRFPLRTISQFHRSLLVSKVEILKYTHLWKQLDETYFQQAKRSLVLLKNLKQIDFHLRSNESIEEQVQPFNARSFHLRWKVVSKAETDWVMDASQDKIPLEDIKSVNLLVISEKSSLEPSPEKDSWLVVTGFLSKNALRESSFRGMSTEVYHNGRQIDSIPDVAIAVRVSSSPTFETCSFYSSLPLPAPIGLPVNCHAHFAMSSDRRSIRIDGTSGDWNRFLADSCLPHLYFVLLEQLCIRGHERYYLYWPPSVYAENTVTQILQSSFWQKVRYSSRKLILSDENTAATFSHTIFDGRVFAVGSGRDGAVVQAVRSLRPFSIVVYQPRLNAGLFRQSEGDQTRDGSDINVLNPAFVRELLREPLAKAVLSCYEDSRLKDILDFVLENGPLERLVGCYIWRLANGDLVKMAPIEGEETKIAYVVDEEGFRLFQDLAGDALIRPKTMKPEILGKWDLGDDFNIRRLDGSTIDKFVELLLPPHSIKIYSLPEKTWISDVWKYVAEKQLSVKFYERRPTLALVNDNFKFVSAEGLNTLPVMCNDAPLNLASICSKLNIFILAESTVEAVVKLSKNWDCQERFLECLLRLKGNLDQLQKTILDPLGPEDVKILRDFCISVYKPSLPPHILDILRHLPIWTSPLSRSAQGKPKSRKHTVAAIRALILPHHERFFEDLTPMSTKIRFVKETVQAQTIVAELGGIRLEPGDYAFNFVASHLPVQPNENQLKSLRELLDNLVDFKNQSDHGSYRRNLLRKERLIPDRTGKLRYGRDLYSSTNPIFNSSFFNDDSAFPHGDFTSLPLDDFGLRTMVTKDLFTKCVKKLEADFQFDPSDRESIWTRCHHVWVYWNQLTFQQFWESQELNALSTVRFVPVLRNTAPVTYRDAYMQELVGSRIIATMQEVISPTYIPIAWTQRIAASTPPAHFLKSVGFLPSVIDVVEHLIALTTTFAAKCSITETHFFEDLAATYSHLNQSANLNEASEYLLSHHDQKPIWLNDDMSLNDISEFIHGHKNSENTVASLNWLPSSSILHGVPYDLPTYGLYSAKLSLEPYRNLLRACGSHVVESIKAVISGDDVENHDRTMMERIRNMLGKQDSMCDMKIVIEKQEHYAHRILLAAVSPYFRRLCCGDWKEKSTGVLNLDERAYGTSESVRSAIEWVYNGFLELDDGVLEDLDDVQNRLDHYLDVLELSNVWDIAELRGHIENRILTYASKFIRVENVSDVFDIATRYNATNLEEFCESFIEKNKRVVELVESSAA